MARDARDGIRTQELLRDQALNLAPLTWLGYPRACIDYVHGLIKVREKREAGPLLFLAGGKPLEFPVPQFDPPDLAGDGFGE